MLVDKSFDGYAVRAATIDERLSTDYEALRGEKADAAAAGTRLAAWCRSASSGDWDHFSSRLLLDGLRFEGVLARFATVRIAGAPPSWLADGRWLLDAIETNGPSWTCPRFTEPAGEPFQHLVIPAVEAASARLWGELRPDQASRWSDQGRLDLDGALLSELCDLMSGALIDQFGTFDASGEPPGIAGASSCKRYHAFVSFMARSGLRNLFDAKPVLFRLFATLTRQWMETTSELIRRFDLDAECLPLSVSVADMQVSGVTGEHSDRHNDGRSVKILHFACGRSVVYKPKSLAADLACAELVARLNAAGGPEALRTPWCIGREGYGWSEFIEHRPCLDASRFSAFFRRAGAWLSLFHALGSVDMHHENLIADADCPVPIDLEMVLQVPALAKTGEEDDAFNKAMTIIDRSVSSIGLLRAYSTIYDFDNSSRSPRAEKGWENLNTDTMRIRYFKPELDARHLPHINGTPAGFGHHIEDFIEGFRRYSLFLKDFVERSGVDAVLAPFQDVAIRFVLRPTKFYGMLIERLKDHRSMYDGVIWSAQCDFISRFLNPEQATPPTYDLHRAEREALTTLNIPHFFSVGGTGAVRTPARAVATVSGDSGLNLARERLVAITSTDIEWQIEIIRQNTSSLDGAALFTHNQKMQSEHKPQHVHLSNERLSHELIKIADHLVASAVEVRDTASWIGLDWPSNSPAANMVPLSANLYSGTFGIGLFLAAAHLITGRDDLRQLALKSTTAFRRQLHGSAAARVARGLGTGGVAGLGSILYALTTMSELLGEEMLRADARRAAELFTDELIAADTRLSVLEGNAGAVLTLLHLYRSERDPRVLGRAVKCGEQLLRHPRIGREGARSWPEGTLVNVALNGFSHGAAGFAYAMAALYRETHVTAFLAACHEALAFENDSFSHDHLNWPDYSGADVPFWPVQWCHGAAGIGHSRLAIAKLDVLPTDVLTRDIDRAVAGVKSASPGAVDTLCCGTLGCVEFLREAGRHLGESDLANLASGYLGGVVEAAAKRGEYRWNAGNKHFNFGLFRGLAGVGYTIARELRPTLPDLLMLR